MKKILGVIFLSLLLSGNSYAEYTQIIKKLSNKPIKEKRILYKKGDVLVAKEYGNLLSYNYSIDLRRLAGYCKKRGNKYFLATDSNLSYFDKTRHRTYYCVENEYEFFSNISKYQDATPPEYFDWNKGSVITVTNISNLKFVSINEYLSGQKTTSSSSSTSGSSSISTKDKITQAKQICTDLGFQPKTEKHADCSMQMMSIQFETTNKVASASGGTTQEVIVTHRNDYDIWDALVDYSRAIDPKNKSTTSSSSNRGTTCVAQTTNSGVTIMNCD